VKRPARISMTSPLSHIVIETSADQEQIATQSDVTRARSNRIVIEIPAVEETIVAPQVGTSKVVKLALEIPAVMEEITPRARPGKRKATKVASETPTAVGEIEPHVRVGTQKVTNSISDIPTAVEEIESHAGLRTRRAVLELGLVGIRKKIASTILCFFATHLAWEFLKLGCDYVVPLVSNAAHYAWVFELLRVLQA